MNSSIMPSGWRCELVDYDVDFGADYYTFFPAPVAMSLNVWDGTIADSFAGGSGTEDNPYLISDGSQMAYLAQKVNSGTNYSGKCFKLTGNIDLNNIGWTPIGTSSYRYFGGNFDGNGYEVKGLYINSTSTYQGLFGYVQSLYFKNIGVVDSNVSGSDYVGGIAGYISGSVNNCYNTGTVTGSGYVGGIAGRINSNITDSYNTGKVTGSGSNTGGIAGYVNNGPIINCHNTNDISGAGKTGGIVGYFSGSSSGSQIMNCYNEGETVTGTSFVGGIIGGSNYSPSIENCYNNAEVKGDSYVNGITWQAVIVTGCYNSGNITSVSGGYTSGIVGNVSSVTDSHNTGNITGGGYIGGIAGKVTNSVINCDNTGSVNGFGDYEVGGIAGYVNNGPIINCHNTNDISGASKTGGIVGYFSGSSSGSQIMNCYNEGETVTGTSRVGGIIGSVNYSPTIENCYNNAEVKGTSYVHGISYAAKTVTGCYNSGNITSVSGMYTAGIVGTVSSVTDSHNTGDITGGGYIGGIAGKVTNSVINCDNTGSVIGFGDYEVGGIAGRVDNGPIINCYNTNSVSGAKKTGGIAGYFWGSSSGSQVMNCYNEGEMVTGTSFVGGVLGGAYYSPSIEDCYNNAEVKGTSYIYGISESATTVTGCYNSGNITASTGNYAAGIVGTASSVKDSYNTGDITAAGNYVGGISGDLGSGGANACYNLGEIKGMSYVGGIAGQVTGNIEKSYNAGVVTASGSRIGGIAGYASSTSFFDCYNTGSVSGGGTTGGIVGYSSTSSIKNCYNAGIISGQSNTGALLGYYTGSPSLINSYYLSGTASDGVGNGNLVNKGIAVTSGVLKSLAPVLGEAYTNDINNVNQGYPILVGLDYSVYIPDKPKRPVIVLIPGIMGTRLSYGSQRIWEPSTWDGITYANLKPYMYCNDDGDPVYTSVVPMNDGKGTANTYQSMYEFLLSNYGNNYDVIFFAYDWRVDNKKTAQLLEEKLSSYDEVIIVAHSMGGLVASKYVNINTANKSKVKKLITIGTPFYGSAKSIDGFETGQLLKTLQNLAMAGHIKNLINNYSSAYQLIPTSKHPTFIKIKSTMGSDVDYTYAQARAFLGNRPWAKTNNGVGSTKSMLVGARDFHDGLSDISADIYYLYGSNISTNEVAVYNTGAGGNSLEYFEYSNAGDGTVLAVSATRDFTSASKTFVFSRVEHGELPDDPYVQNKVKQIINGVSTFSLQVDEEIETEEPQTICAVIQGVDNVEIKDENGDSIYIQGEDLLNAEQERIGTVWLIDLERNRFQYILPLGEYTFTMSGIDLENDISEALIFQYENREYISYVNYKEFAYENEVILNVGDEIIRMSKVETKGIESAPTTNSKKLWLEVLVDPEYSLSGAELDALNRK